MARADMAKGGSNYPLREALENSGCARVSGEGGGARQPKSVEMSN